MFKSNILARKDGVVSRIHLFVELVHFLVLAVVGALVPLHLPELELVQHSLWDVVRLDAQGCAVAFPSHFLESFYQVLNQLNLILFWLIRMGVSDVNLDIFDQADAFDKFV